MFDTFTRLVTDASGWTYGIIAALRAARRRAARRAQRGHGHHRRRGLLHRTPQPALWSLSPRPSAPGLATTSPTASDGGTASGPRPGSSAATRPPNASPGPNDNWAKAATSSSSSAGSSPPAGTLITLTAGTLAYPWRRFALFDAVAAVIWALYAGLLGYFGGKAFEDAPWKGLLLAFGLALAVTGGIELFRWLRRRRRAAARR